MGIYIELKFVQEMERRNVPQTLLIPQLKVIYIFVLKQMPVKTCQERVIMSKMRTMPIYVMVKQNVKNSLLLEALVMQIVLVNCIIPVELKFV